MSSELDDILERRRVTKERLQELYTGWAPLIRRTLQVDGTARAIVIILKEDLSGEEFVYPTFASPEEKWDAFKKVNQHLRATNAAGVVLVQEYWLRPEEGEDQEALIFILHTHGWRRAFVHKFDRNERGEIQFEKEIEDVEETELSSDNLITAYSEMH